jgi:Leucine-rich repeat (LRR) protein
MAAAAQGLPVAERVILSKDTLGPITNIDTLDTDAPYNTTVRKLTIKRNNLTECPPLPQQATTVYIRENQITRLAPMPPTLVTLDVEQNQIAEFPDLPAPIVACKIQRNQLTQVPSLAHLQNLTSLGLSRNQIATIGAFPPNVVNIGLNFNPIQRIPPLPASTHVLSIHDSGLREAPVLNEGLGVFTARNSQLTEIPLIPDSLYILDVTGCPLGNEYLQILQQVNQQFPPNQGNPQPGNPAVGFLPVQPGVVNGNIRGLLAMQLLRELLNQLIYKRRYNNLTTFRTTLGNLKPRNNRTTGYWYEGALNPAEANEELTGNAGNVAASMLSGFPGPQKIQALRLRELLTRPPGGAGVGGRRTRRKGRKAPHRKTRK